MHKKTHNTQPSKPPAMAGTGDTFEMDAGDTTPGGMAAGVLQEKVPALLCSTMGAPTQPTPKRADMTEKASPDRLQGQLIATNVLLEAVLRILPAQTLKSIRQEFDKNGVEVEGHLLNTPGSEAMLDAYRSSVESTGELLTRIHQQAIFRDSAAGKL